MCDTVPALYDATLTLPGLAFTYAITSLSVLACNCGPPTNNSPVRASSAIGLMSLNGSKRGLIRCGTSDTAPFSVTITV